MYDSRYHYEQNQKIFVNFLNDLRSTLSMSGDVIPISIANARLKEYNGTLFHTWAYKYIEFDTEEDFIIFKLKFS